MKQRFQCSSSTRKLFVQVISEVMAARTVAGLFRVTYLDAQSIGSNSRLISVKVDKSYRLELMYQEEAGAISQVTIRRLIKT